MENFKLLRKDGRIDSFISIFLSTQNQSVSIASDGGRVCRPLIIVSEGRSCVSGKDISDVIHGIKMFDDLVREGKIEYLDVNEEGDQCIAVYEKDITYDSNLDQPGHPDSEASAKTEKQGVVPSNTTHLEIAPLALLGAVAGLIPYPHHNRMTRP